MPQIENFMTARELALAILALPEATQGKPFAVRDGVRHMGVLRSSTHLPTHLQVQDLDHTGYIVYPSSCYSDAQREAFKSIVVLGERHDFA